MQGAAFGKSAVYMAAQYPRREELKAYAAEARREGFEITARWLDETHSPNVKMTEVPERELKDIALQDRVDIERSDVMIFFAENQFAQPPRGGRHVEFGMALAMGKRIIVVGEPENVFHHLPGVFHAPDWNFAFGMLKALHG
jgi:nucleoside 2-deoxyribosyltransferase